MQRNFRTQYLLIMYYRVTPRIRGWNTQPMRRGYENWACLVENYFQIPWENLTAFHNPRGGYLEDSSAQENKKRQCYKG